MRIIWFNFLLFFPKILIFVESKYYERQLFPLIAVDTAVVIAVILFVHIWKHFLLIYKFKYLGCLFKSKQPKKATAPRMPHLVVTVPPLKSPATGSSFLGRANFWSVLRIRVVNPYQECRDKPPFPAIVGVGISQLYHFSVNVNISRFLIYQGLL